MVRPKVVRLLGCGLVLLAGSYAGSARAQATAAEIELRMDAGPAAAVLELFDTAPVERERVEALLDIPAVRQMVAQTRRFDAAATDAVFVDSLAAALEGTTIEVDPFGFSRLESRLDEIRSGLHQLQKGEAELAENIRQRVAHWAPRDLDIEATIFVVLGGSSDGWAPGDGNFYLAMQYFRDDVVGLTAMATHELYHVLQPQILYPSEDDSGQASALLTATLAEGTATLVGNPLTFSDGGAYLDFLQRKHSRNLRRLRQNFQLFEALYYRLASDPTVSFGDVYDLGFSGGWDSPLYFVGFHVAEAIERHRGTPALLSALQNTPADAVFADYIELYRETDDPALVRFSPTVEALLLDAE